MSNTIECFGIVYKSTNNINNKSYIGQTVCKFGVRKLQHINDSKAGRDNTYFHNAIRKYGSDNFEWEILGYCYSKKELDSREKWFIKKYKTFQNGYNLTAGGGGMVNYLITEEHRRNLSKSHEGYKHTNEQRQKISKALKNRPCSEKTRKKLSVSKLGNKNPMYGKFGIENPAYGRKQSYETVEKIRNSNSLYWEIIFPNGDRQIIKNLSNFCRENNLSKGIMGHVSKGLRAHHKGYRCKKLGQMLIFSDSSVL